MSALIEKDASMLPAQTRENTARVSAFSTSTKGRLLAIIILAHNILLKRQDQPHPHVEPTYGAKQQYAEDEDVSPKLAPSSTKEVQEIVGSLLYYALALDNTMLVALGDLAAAQSQPTWATWDTMIWILNYAVMYPL